MKATFFFGSTVLVAASIGLYAGQQQPQNPTIPPSGTLGNPPAGAPPPGPGAQGGRGGGRGNPMAAKYT